MQLGELRPAKGSKFKAWRKGRGPGTGNGKLAGRGRDGQKSRSGGGVRPLFEGGQLPLFRRLPKRGFKNRNSLDIVTLNVYHLNVFDDGAVVDIAALKSKGLVSNPRDGVKILGQGKLERKLDVQVNYYSETAKEKIEAAGGRAEVI
ncbi:MAG: 50S ribosomal protein L15 [Clostridiales bacterium]|jgi:large subunit ribosomal protein L15|nr:50S ribosomal protein L15 [Clostridiales bacterium]